MSTQNKKGEYNLTLSTTKRSFLKRPIYKIPCQQEGCKIVIHTRSFNRKKCYRHVTNAKYKISQRSKDKRKLEKSPYSIAIQKTRECLKCGCKFGSVSEYNRICKTCNAENDQLKSEKLFLGWKLRSDDLEHSLKFQYYEKRHSPDGIFPAGEKVT
jgi:hypothetical protein